MTVKIVASFSVLMKKASILGKAKKFGSSDEIMSAQKDFDAYLEICKQSDRLDY